MALQGQRRVSASVNITPSDTILANPVERLYVTVSGNLVIKMSGSQSVTSTLPATAGQDLQNLSVSHVMAATTATVVGFY